MAEQGVHSRKRGWSGERCGREAERLEGPLRVRTWRQPVRAEEGVGLEERFRPLARCVGLVGSVRRRGFFNREWTVDVPEELPLEVRVFVVWLVIILWKREDSATAAGAASTAGGLGTKLRGAPVPKKKWRPGQA